MKSYVIEGGKKLIGNVKISGAKNASLPILAATLLNSKDNILYNIPNITDINIMIEILKFLGCKVKRNSGKIVINSRDVIDYSIPETLMRKMRSSVIIAGALISRLKKVEFSYPGGCDIGARPIDLHLEAFKKMGIEVFENGGKIRCESKKIVGNTIDLDFPSVGATENIILVAALAEGTTYINNAAREPEIVDLVKFLNKMGAKIEGEGTGNIKIIGVKTLKSISYNIMPDRIEAGTFLCAAATTSGHIIIDNIQNNALSCVSSKLKDCGCSINISKNSMEIQAPKRLKAVNINTLPYPGFPTDLQQIFVALLLKAKGTSIIVENIFENRFKYLSELRKMGAKYKIEGKTVIIEGIKKLNPTNLTCYDLRGGAAMIIAAIGTKGKTKIDGIEFISRGYENIEKKLISLDADIKVV